MQLASWEFAQPRKMIYQRRVKDVYMLCSMIIFLDSRLCTQRLEGLGLEPAAPTSRKNSEIFSLSFMNFPPHANSYREVISKSSPFSCLPTKPSRPWRSQSNSPGVQLRFHCQSWPTPVPWRFQNRWSILSIPCCRPDHHAIPRETLQRPEGCFIHDPTLSGETCRWDSPLKHRET